MSATASAAPPSRSGSVACLGSVTPGGAAPAFTPDAVLAHAGRFREPCFVIRDARQGHIGVAFGDQGRIEWGERGGPYSLLACLAPVYPEWLGDQSFNEVHGVRFPYVAGE